MFQCVFLSDFISTTNMRGTTRAIRSHGYHDLAELAVVLEIAVHFPHLVELEAAVDHRPERAALEALEHILHRGLATGLVAAGDPEGVGRDRHELSEHFQHWDGSGAFVERAVDEGDTLESEHGD